jgi:hypothetical protein
MECQLEDVLEMLLRYGELPLDDVLANDIRVEIWDRADIYDCAVNFIVQVDTLVGQRPCWTTFIQH